MFLYTFSRRLVDHARSSLGRSSRRKGATGTDEPPISRGFRSRRQEEGLTNRVPFGQYVTTDFPVLSAGPTPQITLGKSGRFRFSSMDGVLGKWAWTEFQALPQTTIKTDIHCVTKWSKLDTIWRGVTFDDLLEAAALTEAPAALTSPWRTPKEATRRTSLLRIWSAARA